MADNGESSMNANDEVTNISDIMDEYSEMTRSLDNNITEACTQNKEQETGRNKRSRGVDQEELWTTISRKGKRFARAADDDELTRIAVDSIEVSITCTEKLPKQFKLAKTLKDQNIEGVMHVKYVNEYKVLLQLDKDENAEKLVKCKLFNENGFRCQKTFEVNKSYGVINNIDLDLSEEEIRESLSCDSLILGIKRLKRRNTTDGRWTDSESIRICFQGNKLPSYVKIFETRIRVSAYVYPVTQCSLCWRFGHSIRTCGSSKPVCPKCGGPHQNCEKTDFQCNNCGGKHMALAKICPVFLKEKRIRELMAEKNCSYKHALVVFDPRARSTPGLDYIDINFPTLTQQHVYTQDPSRESRLKSSYAEVTEQGPSTSQRGYRPQKPITEKKKTRRSSSDYLVYSDIDTGMEFMTEPIGNETLGQREQERRETNRRRKEPIEWKEIFKKLKDKILERDISWDEKIKDSLSIIFDYGISLIIYYLPDWSCFNFISKYV